MCDVSRTPLPDRVVVGVTAGRWEISGNNPGVPRWGRALGLGRPLTRVVSPLLQPLVLSQTLGLGPSLKVRVPKGAAGWGQL